MNQQRKGIEMSFVMKAPKKKMGEIVQALRAKGLLVRNGDWPDEWGEAQCDFCLSGNTLWPMTSEAGTVLRALMEGKP
jgi:hypothetical protein